jgi:hypothetical protein
MDLFIIFQGLLGLVVAASVALIAYRQWRTEQNKLKLELFDRRWKIYGDVNEVLGHIFREADADLPVISQYSKAIRDVDFLFNKEIYEYFDELRKKIILLRTSRERFSPLPVGEERTRWVNENHETLMWIVGQSDVLKEKVRPFLHITHE